MRAFMLRLLFMTMLPLAASAVLRAADAQLMLPDFHALEAKANESVNVTLDSSLLAMAARFLDPNKPEDAAARQVIAGLTGIYVRSFTFDGDFAYPKEEVDA